ncbi:MAG: hypothetical protein HYZ21_13415 [Chloroflexi bacterium]|nr:hypothetical protein [Chloroflexota bacterium]
MGALQDAAADRKRGQEGRDGQEGAQDKPEGSTASSGLGLKPPRDWVDRLGRSEIADPSPEEAQAAFRQSERDYRNSTEHSVAGSSYVAQSGDSISRILGTSDPQAIGNFIRANGLTSSHIVAGRNYFVPDDANAYGDSVALGQAVLHGDNARLEALAQQRAAQQQAQWDALQTGAWRGRTDTQGGPVWHGGAPARSTSATNSPHTGWWPALTGAATGVGQSLAHMAQGAVQTGADSLEQLGDILTFGANHDHPQMQEVWQRQRERGQALGRLASDPTGVATDMMESVAHRYGAANAITDNDYERSRQLGYLFNDVGQGLLGAGTALRGASRLGATGVEMLGENAFNEPLAGGRAAQRGGVEFSGEEANSISRVFSSGDPMVGQTATAIDHVLPGAVKNVNTPIRNDSVGLSSDADIVLKNGDVIEVKSGGGKGATTQIANQTRIIGDSGELIVYGPNLKQSVISGIQKSGTKVFVDLNDLLNYIRSKGL